MADVEQLDVTSGPKTWQRWNNRMAVVSNLRKDATKYAGIRIMIILRKATTHAKTA